MRTVEQPAGAGDAAEMGSRQAQVEAKCALRVDASVRGRMLAPLT